MRTTGTAHVPLSVRTTAVGGLDPDPDPLGGGSRSGIGAGGGSFTSNEWGRRP